MTLPDFSNLFVEGREIGSEIGRVVLSPRPAGKLKVTSGKVVACDPLASPETPPFVKEVPAGVFSVTLSVASFEDGDRRVAAALVRFAEREAVRWELALHPDEDVSDLEEGEVFGYPVDSGTGCFMDGETARRVVEDVDPDEFSEALIEEMERTYETTWSWADIEVEPGAGANVVAFSAGVGDGMYASYFGLDAGGEVVCLVTDFSLFEYEEFA
jgi:hypothetical protein